MRRSTAQPWLPATVLLVAAAAFVLFPPTAVGKIIATIDGGDTGVREGDPIDSNDYGSGGGGGDDDVRVDYLVEPVKSRVPVVVLGQWLLVLVPDGSLGVPVFSFVVFERDALGGEGWDAQ